MTASKRRGGEGIAVRAWLDLWRALQWYHRYTVVGLDKLCAPGSGPYLIVGYHGRPAATDMCMLAVRLYDELGYLPPGMVHRGAKLLPPLKWLMEDLGFVTDDGESLASAIAQRKHVMVTPGGGREAGRSYRHRYEVHWGDRIGYLRLALKYQLEIVPVAAAGVDHMYFGLNDSSALGRRLRLPRDWEPLPWLAVGPLGLFPVSPPFRARIRQLVGDPIDPTLDPIDSSGGTAVNPVCNRSLLRVHREVTRKVQELLDRARMPGCESGDRRGAGASGQG